MAEYPNISTGLGKLTPQVWARLMRMLQSYESTYPRDERQAIASEPAKATTFLAEITKAKVLAVQPSGHEKAYKFRYAWNSVTIDGVDGEDTQYTATTDTGVNLKTSTFDGDEFYYAALNATEIRGTVNYATGIRISGDSYLESYYPMPFGGATSGDLDGLSVDDSVDLAQELITVIHKFPDADGIIRYVFNDMMLHDGGCD